MNPQIGKLESLLARVLRRSQEPRVHHMAEHANETVAPPSIQTVPPSPDAREVIAEEMIPTPVPPPPVVAVAAPAVEPDESRSQLVAARPAEEPTEELLELDDRHVVTEEASIEVIEEEVEPPPSSRRTKPLDEVPEPAVAHPAPPESGRQIAAAQELDFEDDMTGVREARKEPQKTPVPEHDEIALKSVEPAQPKGRSSMEMEIPTLGAPGAFTPDVAPSPPPVVVAPPVAVPEPAASQVQVVRAELRQTEVAQVSGNVPASFEPKTFGELLDAALSL